MKPGNRPRVVRIALILLSLAVASWAQETSKNAVRLDGGVLKRGSSDFTVRGIYVPDLAKPGVSRDDVVRAFDQVASVGGVAVCFDLYGFDESGKELSTGGIEALRQIKNVAEQRNMIGVVRVFGPHAPSAGKARLAAARTAAGALRDERQFLYLLEGRDSKRFAREFHRRAPFLTVAAPEGGEIDVVTKPEDMGLKKPSLLLGAVPPELADQAHFILPEGELSFEILEAASVLPVENQPWAPDNSMLTEQEVADGWIALFDGKTLNGWTVLGAPNAWQVHDGIVERVASGSMGLRTRNRFDNYILKWEWNLPEGGNNGVHLRAPRAGRASRIGFEYQMLGDYGKPPDKNSTGSVYDVVPPTANAVKPQGEWNSSEVVLDGPHLRYVLNGVTIQDLNMDDNDELRLRLRNGFIVLTEHSSSVQYRNIKIKPLTPASEQGTPK